ncbi:MAG: hypothetical protein V7638_474 [Acidobacteriota bacterium]|jgi:hypothetical protein
MKPNQHVRANVTDDNLIVLDLVKGQIFTANTIGSRIWRGLFVDNQPKEQLVEAIATEWETTPEIVAKDVEKFVVQLRQQGLVADS